MGNSADTRRLRIDDEAARDEASRLPGSPSVGAAALACTVTGGGANQFCTCQPKAVTGTETQGTAGTLASTGATIVALNLGAADPTGKTVVVTAVDFRWVLRYDG